jgi:hypothetical protein
LIKRLWKKGDQKGNYMLTGDFHPVTVMFSKVGWCKRNEKGCLQNVM